MHDLILFMPTVLSVWSRGSSVSTVSDYRLDDWAIGVRSTVEAKDFPLPLCPDRLWGRPSLLSNIYQGSFPG
jgi:hypothetical protein